MEKFFIFLLLPILVTSDLSDGETVFAHPGQSCSLPCRLPEAKEVKMLEWSKPDLGPEGYLLFYRERRLYPHYQHRAFSNRVKLQDPQLRSGDLSVTLLKVTLSDSGTYSCVVKASGEKQTVSHTVNLRVTEETQPRAEKMTGGSAGTETKEEGVKDTGDTPRNHTVTGIGTGLFIAACAAFTAGFIHRKYIKKPVPTEEV